MGRMEQIGKDEEGIGDEKLRVETKQNKPKVEPKAQTMILSSIEYKH
jgi:hypothetical protein